MSDTNQHYSIVLLRHAESYGNVEGFFQGQSDFPLTSRGQKQARALAARWKEERVIFDQIISSPLIRARETAEILHNELEQIHTDNPLTLEFNPLWMERDVGLLAGLHRSEAEQRYPRPEFIHLYQPIGITGESQWQLYLRAGQAVLDLLQRPPGRYLVVSHGGILNMVLFNMLGIVPQANFHGAHFQFFNSAFTTLTYSPEVSEWRLVSYNDYAHWPAIGEMAE